VRPLGEGRHSLGQTVWSIADVTRELERQENVFQELQNAIDYLDHAPAGFFSVDANGEIGYLNATLAEWLDYDLAQFGSGGLKLDQLVAGQGAALLTTLSAPPGEVKTEIFDIDLKTRGGRTLPVRLFHKVAFGADGAPGSSRTLVLNRARDHGSDPQRLAEVRFMRFFQNTPMAIATVDKPGKIIRSNVLFARLFRPVLKTDGPDGGSILAVVAERDRAALEAAIRRAADKQGEIAPVEAALAGPGERFARFYVTAVEEEVGDHEAAIVYGIETTEQRTLESQFTQSQKMELVGKLAGGIAHDFNNVLGAIMMATDFLVNAHKPTDPSFQDIMQIRQNANRAAGLVRHLLAFSRKQTLRPQVLSLGEALSDLHMLLKRLIGENVTLSVVPDRDLWPVKVDIAQFEQVIVNLAVNARDAMPDGGKLTIRTANVSADEGARFNYKGMPIGEYVLIEVADSGTGIAPEIIDKIFEPFFTTKEVNKGTGLGLSTVYGIVKQSSGYVFAESELGAGTTFYVYLPRVEESAEELSPAQSQQNDAGGCETVLLVEDEESVRELVRVTLASRGYQVLEAENGESGLRIAESFKEHIDILITDVVMPGIGGRELARKLLLLRPAISVLYLSGYTEDAVVTRGALGPRTAFLQKPFTLQNLAKKVREVLHSKSAPPPAPASIAKSASN
jgi:two-component system cell cycle sensor histidine kinase/response regulator CckA